MLAGSVTGEIFTTQNPEEKFVAFRRKNWGEIEQILLSLRDELPILCEQTTDALRIQALCDFQKGDDGGSKALIRAQDFGILVKEREIPLPSTFMTATRELGIQHKLILPPD